MTHCRNIIFMLLLVHCHISAQADISTKRVVNGVVIYEDAKAKGTFYYAPYGLNLVYDADGKPDFRFIQMRYTGTRASGDQGSHRFRSILQFKVSSYNPSKTQREDIVRLLEREGIKVVHFRPIHISNLEATLIHSADTGLTSDSVQRTFSGGFFENTESTNAGVYWKERDFTLRLDNEDAQLFWETFQNNQPTLSVNYTFTSNIINTATDTLDMSGSGELSEALETHIRSETETTRDSTLQKAIVSSGALSIYLNTDKWPELARRIDINERIPPEYAALDIYCYDFNNGIRTDLYAKRIEIKARSVNGREVYFKHSFRATEPDIYAKTIRFIYAVKLSEPYQHRITEIFNDGGYHRSDWQAKSSWHEILDITTQTDNN